MNLIIIREVFKVTLTVFIIMVFVSVILLVFENKNRESSKVVLKQIHMNGFNVFLCQRDLLFGFRIEQFIEVDDPFTPGTKTIKRLVIGTTAHAYVKSMKLIDNYYPLLEIDIIADGKQFMLPIDLGRLGTNIDLDYGFW